jgi:hypothetical protein
VKGMQGWKRNMKKGTALKTLVYGVIRLKWILQEYSGVCWIHLWVGANVGCCEHRTESSGFIKLGN